MRRILAVESVSLDGVMQAPGTPKRTRGRIRDAIRADLLSRLGRPDEAIAAYEAAIPLTENADERAFLLGRRADLTTAR